MADVFGERLKKYRGKKSQSEFAAFFNISQAHLSSLECGVCEPAVSLLQQIADKTSISVSYWLGETDDGVMNGGYQVQGYMPAEIIVAQAQVLKMLKESGTMTSDERKLMREVLAACSHALDESPERADK